MVDQIFSCFRKRKPSAKICLPFAFSSLFLLVALVFSTPVKDVYGASAYDQEKDDQKLKQETHEALPPINWTSGLSQVVGNERPPYLARLINFGIFVAIFYFFARKPIRASLKSRKENIMKGIDEAAKMKREASTRAEKYQGDLMNLGKLLEQIHVAAAAAGEHEKAKLIESAEEEAERLKKDALFRIEQEEKQLRDDLMRQVADDVTLRAESWLGRVVSESDHHKLLQDFLLDLDQDSHLKVGAPSSKLGRG